MTGPNGSFVHRGVIEGFYGPPWSHEDRLWLVERIGAWGMNRFVVAPKDDPLQRERWREPYSAETLRRFETLVERGAEAGVEVGFSVSPGLSMVYASAEERDLLVAKLRSTAERGSGFATLALDDVPTRLRHDQDRAAFASLAEAHCAVAEAVREALPDLQLWLVPTDYVGTEPTDYLETLGERLDPSVEVGWTGRTLISPTLESEEARQRAETLGRSLLVWDNVPVADGPMRRMLHLGPYRGRDPDLADHCSGVLLNGMQHPRASALAFHTAAAYLRDPTGYEPEAAWAEAVAELGAGAPDTLALFAAAHRFSPLDSSDRDAGLEAAFESVRAAAGEPSAGEPLAAFEQALAERHAVGALLREHLADRALLAEIEPWIEAHGRETERMQSAARLLRELWLGEHRMDQVRAFFRFESALATPPPELASYGPRRVLYPQLACLRDDAAAFGDDPALFVGRCLADEVVRFAEGEALYQLR